MAFNNKKNDKKEQISFEPKVGLSKYDKDGNLIIVIGSINFNDITRLNQAGKNVFQIKKPNNSSNSNFLYLYVNGKHIEEFKNMFGDIKNIMEQTGHYDNSKLDDFFTKINTTIDKTVTKSDIEANDTRIAENWKELLKILKNPKNREKFLLLQTTPTFKTDYSKSMLSPENIREVLMADPLASFVTSEESWESLFNRKVVDTSRPIIITKVLNSNIPSYIMNKLPEVAAQGGWDKLCKENGYRLHDDPLYGFIKDARVKFKLGGSRDFFKAKVYDVRFTQLIPGAEDKFLTIPRLVNNLTGEINDAAKKVEAERLAKENKPIPDFDEKKYGLNKKEISKFKENLIKLCGKKNIAISTTGSDEDVIVKGTYNYAYAISSSLNILNPNNKKKFASAMVVVVANTFNIESSLIEGYAKNLPSINDENALEEISKTIHGVYTSLVNGESIDESILKEMKLLSVSDIKNILKKHQKSVFTETKNKIFDLMSRMEKI